MDKNDITKVGQNVTAKNEFFRFPLKRKTVLAGRILMSFASLIKKADISTGSSSPYCEFSIHISEVAKDIQIGGHYKDEIVKACEDLVATPIKRLISPKEFDVYSLFSKLSYRDGVLTGQIHQDILPFFILEKDKLGCFTSIALAEYNELGSTYSQALFAYLKSYSRGLKANKVTVPLSELYDLLGVPESIRKDFAQFRRSVLERADREIAGKLYYRWKAIKAGRKYVSIEFSFPEDIEVKTKAPARGRKSKTEADTTPPASSSLGPQYACYHTFGKGSCTHRNLKLLCEGCPYDDSKISGANPV